MASERTRIDALRECWAAFQGPTNDTDYELLVDCGGAFAACSRHGLAALVLPLDALGPATVGRRASGCELVGHAALRFSYRGRKWEGAAAALLCTDAALVDTFAVLAADVLVRTRTDLSWASVVAVVEEWQTLLTPRGKPSRERELGLWGELWFIEQSRDVGRTLSAWRGPEADVADFFCGGVGVEVKASKTERQHFVSQTQLEAPVGSHDSWLLSLWVKADPGSLLTVPWLAEAILARAPNQGEALRWLARAGYSPSDRLEYTTAFTLLAEPEWFAIVDVPRVRAADPGVSHLRYRVALDQARRADAEAADRLWRHFHEQGYGTER